VVVTAVYDSGPAGPGYITVPGSRLFAKRGTDPNHAYLDADSFVELTIPSALADCGPTYAVCPWHTGHCAIYIETGGITSEKVQLCLSKEETASGVQRWRCIFQSGAAALAHDGNHLGASGWVKLGTATIIPPSTWKVYEFSPPAHFVATE